jgi:hypothetical protein
MPKTSRVNRERFIEAALTHIGYTARATKENAYGALTGYNSQYWGGSYLDVIARDAGVYLPAFAYPPAALAEFVRQKRVHRKPRRGDIVFFAAQTNGEAHFTVPHVGLVTDTARWRTHASFKVIEAQTSTGLPKGPQDPNGIYLRTRYATDVLVFARPDYNSIAASAPAAISKTVVRLVIRPSNLVSTRPNGKAIETVQLALSKTVGLRQADRGIWNAKTKSAYAAWQRKIGYVGPDANGVPDVNSLERLARDTEFSFAVAD